MINYHKYKKKYLYSYMDKSQIIFLSLPSSLITTKFTHCHFYSFHSSFSLFALKDDDYAISRKVKKVLSQGLIPVLCVGESR